MTNSTWQKNGWLGSALGVGVVATAALAGGCTSSSTMDIDSGTTADTGTGDAGASTLYERLGKHAGIRAAVDAIVAAELQNSDIASYFFFQGGAPGNGHPTADQISECFTDFVGMAVMGPESYPTTVTTDAGSFTCRPMMTIHAPLLISGGTFDKFVMIAGATLASAGVAPADVSALATALGSTKSQIVSASLADAGLQAFPGDASPGQ